MKNIFLWLAIVGLLYAFYHMFKVVWGDDE